MNKQTIKCNVYDCIHCNFQNNSCLLEEIMISMYDRKNKNKTICGNFQTKE